MIERVLAGLVLCTAFSGVVPAQGFPTKPIRVLNAMGPGTLDNFARLYAQDLSRLWGQPVVVEARPGGNTAIATDQVVRAPADGYTLLATSSTTFTIAPFLSQGMPADLDRELKPLFAIGRLPVSVFVASSLNVRTLHEFVALAKQKPGALTYGSTGAGGVTHLQTALFLSEVGGINVLHVPYKAVGDYSRGLISGEVQFGLHSHVLVAAGLKSGQLVQIAHVAGRRHPEFPDVPTVRESGFPNASNSLIWFGFGVPAKTPQAIVDKLAAELARLSNEPAQRVMMEKFNWEPMLLGPEPFAEVIRRERALVAKLVAELGLKPE